MTSNDEPITGGIPDDAVEDEPQDTASDNLKEKQLPTPEQKHSWGVENFKNGAAFWLLTGCLGAILILGIVDRCFGDASTLKTVVETLKVVATTSLGFLFGRNSK
ncbi:hypothetical protein BAAM0499_03195 [Bifidobacterium animalis subsp. animalis MCC 0499]|uniref:hypothetical protein n=1 Tax=Bifidobacterium animalis TaxID=28025 RepID=UPI0006998F58|nr:hypothetical protein [Bifidobacterium animalis]KOA60897.1 hypothetical protein BAAM0499_03195 [Bifidobacterium animalis subsp. animalis MCC 0499]